MVVKSTTTTATVAPPLNVYQKVAVIRLPSDSLTYEDAEGNQKSVSVEELGDAISSATPLHTPRVKLDIPVPRINKVESYERDVPANFTVPLSFTRFNRPSVEEWKVTLEYIADAEDEAWLYHNTKFGHAAGLLKNKDPDTSVDCNSTHSEVRRPQLSLAVFELMFDQLEKATGFEFIISIHQADTLFKEKIPQLYQTFPAKARPGMVTVKQVLQEVYDYWVQKRSKLKRPLLRRFWPVTSSDDTNPHLVFRPREKEKYKLRKKRQNDANAYRKMKQLREDFDNLRAVLDLARRREEIHRVYVQLQIEHFQQRLYDIVDTSGLDRPSSRLRKDYVQRVLDVPTYFDVRSGGRKAIRTRASGGNGATQSLPSTSTPFLADTKDRSGRLMGVGGVGEGSVNVAGRNNGEPAPNFLHPLPTRESYVTSWEGAVPHVPTYEDSHPQPVYRFRHRPRVGRGGRICIDRLPLPVPPPELHEKLTPMTYYTAGFTMCRSIAPKERLLELLPQPIDHEAVSQRIEAIAAASLQEGLDARRANAVVGNDNDENDGDEVIVKLEDWLETDDQLWGDERYAIGPI